VTVKLLPKRKSQKGQPTTVAPVTPVGQWFACPNLVGCTEFYQVWGLPPIAGVYMERTHVIEPVSGCTYRRGLMIETVLVASAAVTDKGVYDSVDQKIRHEAFMDYAGEKVASGEATQSEYLAVKYEQLPWFDS
jgi:hypothetical protein